MVQPLININMKMAPIVGARGMDCLSAVHINGNLGTRISVFEKIIAKIATAGWGLFAPQTLSGQECWMLITSTVIPVTIASAIFRPCARTATHSRPVKMVII
jgi:hypothetical protein